MVSRCRRRLGAGSSRTTCSAVYRHETQGGDASHQSGTKLSRAAWLTDQHEPWVRASLLASPWVAQVLMLLSNNNNNNKLTSLHLTVPDGSVHMLCPLAVGVVSVLWHPPARPWLSVGGSVESRSSRSSINYLPYITASCSRGQRPQASNSILTAQRE